MALPSVTPVVWFSFIPTAVYRDLIQRSTDMLRLILLGWDLIFLRKRINFICRVSKCYVIKQQLSFYKPGISHIFLCKCKKSLIKSEHTADNVTLYTVWILFLLFLVSQNELKATILMRFVCVWLLIQHTGSHITTSGMFEFKWFQSSYSHCISQLYLKILLDSHPPDTLLICWFHLWCSVL